MYVFWVGILSCNILCSMSMLSVYVVCVYNVCSGMCMQSVYVVDINAVCEVYVCGLCMQYDICMQSLYVVL